MLRILIFPLVCARIILSRIIPASMIGAALGGFLLVPLEAQAQTGPSPQYPLTWSLNEVIGDGTLPNGGTPPDVLANSPPAFNETIDASAWVVPTVDGEYTDLSTDNYSTYEAKARFICNPAKVGVFDFIRGFGQNPFGHGHLFFGNLGVNESSTFTTLRANPNSTCAGGVLNGSSYWSQWIVKQDVFKLGHPLIKKWDSTSLYYNAIDCYGKNNDRPDYTTINRCQPLYRGLQLVFGRQIDNEWAWFNTAVANFSAAHPELGVMSVVPTEGAWRCENGNGHISTSPYYGENQPYLSDGQGNVALNCPRGQHLINAFTSSMCWDGRLKAPDGFSNLVPVVTFSADGKRHCPNHFYRLVTIFVNFNYSHNGPTDYVKWTCSSDAAASAALKRTMKPCESTHNDYGFGWHEPTSNKWQCLILGISVNGMTGCHAAEGNNSAISPTERLKYAETSPLTGKPIAVNTNAFYGDKLTDWYVPTQAQRGVMDVHAGMPSMVH